MSLFQLGCNATRRQQNDKAPNVERGDIGVAGAAMPTSAPQSSAEQKTKTEEAIEPIVEYFPAETIALFLAAVSFWNSLDTSSGITSLSYRLGLVAVFTVLTPLMVLLIAYATHRETQRMGLMPIEQRFVAPQFDLFASATAFVPWALAVPGLFPKERFPEGQIAGGAWTTEVIQLFAVFLAFAVSWFLSQGRRIVGPTTSQGMIE